MNKNKDKVEVYKLWVLFHQSHYAIEQLRQKELDELGISMTQATVLSIIKTMNVPPTPAEISRRIFREPNTISELINRMAKQGLIIKVKDLERKNMVRIALTPKGDDIYEQSRKAKYISEIFTVLSESDIKQLNHYLKLLRNRAMSSVELKRQVLIPK
ncbi:MAG: MarR family transcriptional regulator [Chloroflexi bacterium]|nr:MarR family transcriptional regulator [Chloroflexota bacterium]